MADDWTHRQYVTARQAAVYLSLHVRTVYRMAVDGRLPSHKVAGSRAVRFARTDVERLLVERRDDDSSVPPREGTPDAHEG
jgi:excisionase family DNA binding protein